MVDCDGLCFKDIGKVSEHSFRTTALDDARVLTPFLVLAAPKVAAFFPLLAGFGGMLDV